jgi:transcriptional regulator with XRE-family HTH domain
MSRPHEAAMLVLFGENLQRVRFLRKLSQQAVAERAGIHRTQISLLEKGDRAPLLPTVVALAGALNVPVGELLVGISFEPDTMDFVVEPPAVPLLYAAPAGATPSS